MGEGEVSIREAISSAYEAVEPSGTPALGGGQPPANPPAEGIPEPKIAAEEPPASESKEERDRVRDQKGRYTKTTSAAPKPAVSNPEARVGEKAAAQLTLSLPPTPSVATAPEYKAPQSWKASVREFWSKLPSEVQAEVDRREKEAAKTLEETSEARKGYQAFREMVSPYEGMIRAQGGEPIRAISDLLQTFAMLSQSPNPAQKAQIVSNIVKTFGVDIAQLDSALAGGVQGGPSGTQTPGEYRDPRVDALLAQLQQQTHRTQESVRRRNLDEVEAFKAKSEYGEFFDDLRNEAADILELADKRGQKLSLEEAFSKAAKMNEDVSRVLAQRKEAQAAKKANVDTQRARVAASSVKSAPTASVINGADSPKDVRGAIMSAWNELEGR